MAQKSTTASRTSRRQVLSAGLAGLAAASVTEVQAGAAQGAAEAAGGWTPKKQVFERPDSADRPRRAAVLLHPFRAPAVPGGHRRVVPGTAERARRHQGPDSERADGHEADPGRRRFVHGQRAQGPHDRRGTEQDLAPLNEAYRGFFPTRRP